MPLYLTVAEGPRADRTRPLLAISDQRLIAELLRAIGQLGDAYVAAAKDAEPTRERLHIIGHEKREDD